MNLLIDENLSPSIVHRLAAKGVPAVHVAHIGLPGVTDPDLWRYAFDHDQVVVTINAADFLFLAGSVELHPGLIVLRTTAGLSRDEQWAWVEPVVDWPLRGDQQLVNEAAIVTGRGKFECIRLPKISSR